MDEETPTNRLPRYVFTYIGMLVSAGEGDQVRRVGEYADWDVDVLQGVVDIATRHRLGAPPLPLMFEIAVALLLRPTTAPTS